MKDDFSAQIRRQNLMTRRTLLQRFGQIGGASMVMGAMSAWDLMAQSAGSRPQLSGEPGDTRVLILGGGISGLVVGHELGRHGYDYRILEARDRVGGLAWTIRRGAEHTETGAFQEHQRCEFEDDQYFNAGPWRIPHRHEGIIGYCKELGVRLEEFRDENTVFYSTDPALGPLANRKIRMHELEADLWGQTSELLVKAANHGSLDDLLTADDRERLVDFLVSAGYLTGPDQVYEPNVRFRESTDSYDLEALLNSPFASQVRSVTANTGGVEPVFQPTGGMMQIPLALERAVGDHLTKGAEVESITQSADEVRVVYRNRADNTRHELVADYVVCCLPMSILKKLQVNFSPEMAAAVNATSHATQAKMGLQMNRRFWEDDDGIYGGHLGFLQNVPESGPGSEQVPFPIPQFSYPSNDYASHKGVLLGFYGNAMIPGLDGVPLQESPIQARVEHVLTHASKVHPQIRDAFMSSYSVWWDLVPYSEGAWARSPGNLQEQLEAADGRIYIGSAAAAEEPDWMEGAVHSAWRTVEMIHARASSEH